jgi:hypothetical protein
MNENDDSEQYINLLNRNFPAIINCNNNDECKNYLILQMIQFFDEPKILNIITNIIIMPATPRPSDKNFDKQTLFLILKINGKFNDSEKNEINTILQKPKEVVNELFKNKYYESIIPIVKLYYSNPDKLFYLLFSNIYKSNSDENFIQIILSDIIKCLIYLDFLWINYYKNVFKISGRNNYVPLNTYITTKFNDKYNVLFNILFEFQDLKYDKFIPNYFNSSYYKNLQIFWDTVYTDDIQTKNYQIGKYSNDNVNNAEINTIAQLISHNENNDQDIPVARAISSDVEDENYESQVAENPAIVIPNQYVFITDRTSRIPRLNGQNQIHPVFPENETGPGTSRIPIFNRHQTHSVFPENETGPGTSRIPIFNRHQTHSVFPENETRLHSRIPRLNQIQPNNTGGKKRSKTYTKYLKRKHIKKNGKTKKNKIIKY